MDQAKKKILIIDDSELILEMMVGYLDEYDCATAKSGMEALEKVKSFDPDLIFLDIVMPGMDGYEVCTILKADPMTKQIPVIVLTGLADDDSRIRGLELGANDFLTKPVRREELLVRASNLLKVKEFEDFLLEHNKILAFEVAERTKDLRSSYIETIQKLTIAAEYKDPETATHIKRIGQYVRLLAKAMGFSEQEADVMYYASPMHDIGKIGIPDHLLLKDHGLTPAEYEVVKNHTVIGGRILGNSTSPILRSAVRFALFHHEQWNGRGYPHGLSGEKIPVEGRIMNLVDQYDALRMKRPYKPAFSHERTMEIITGGDGKTDPSHFDPAILRAFADLHASFNEIYETYIE